MKPLPKVSVIIPNYNHAAFLERRINTVLHQTYSNIEVIILDDCSSDNSRGIISQYRQHPKVAKIILNETNSGSPFAQWKKGLDYASGDWIWIAESDDYADFNFLEKLVGKSMEAPSSGLIYSDSIAIDNDGVIIENFVFSMLKNANLKTNHWSNDYDNVGLLEIEDYLLNGGTINNTSAVIFKKDVLIAANIFDKRFRYIGDKYAFIKVLSISNISYINQPLNYYRINPHDTSLVKHELRYCYEHFVVFDSILNQQIPISKKKFYTAFYNNLQLSFYKNWSIGKLKVFMSMFEINPVLFYRFMLFNLTNPIIVRFFGK